MKSDFLKLKSADFWKGLFVATFTAGFSTLYQLVLTTDNLPSINFKFVGMSALTAFLGYIMKNLLTNSNDQILKRENGNN